ncbi:MAG: GAF domain-containing protein, partial [Anaerolineae bacterium]
DINETGARMLGYTREELIGRHVSQILAPEFHDRLREEFARSQERQEPLEMEVPYRRKDGSTLWCHLRTEWVRDEAGHVLYTRGVARDITERKRAEEALHQQFEQLQAIYHLSDAVSRTEAIEEVYEEALDSLQRTLKADRAAVLLFDPDGVMRFKAWRALSEGYRQAAEGHSPWQPDEKHPQPVLVPDVREEPTLERLRSVILSEGIHALGFIPLVYQGRLLGKFMIYYNAPHQFNADEVQLAQTIAGHIAFAIERARTEAALRRRAEELAVLHETSLDITMPHNLPTLLHTIVERAARLLDAPSGSLFLCDPERQEVRCVVSYNTPRDYTGTVLKYGEGSAGIVAQTGEPLNIDDYRIWPGRAAAYEEDQPFTAVLSAPMIWHGQVTGVIHVLHDVERRRFTQADLELLTQFANQAAIAVEDARLLEAERRRADELDALRETLADISAELELPKLLHTVLQRAVTLLGVTGGDLGLYDEEKQEVVIVQSYNMGKDYAGTRLALGEGAMGRVAQTGEPVIVDDYTTWEDRSPQYAEGPWLAVMATPLMARGRLIGALGIVDADPVRRFTPSDVHRLSLFADQAAIVVEKARLLEEAQVRARRQAALVQLSADLAATLDDEEVCHRVVQGLHDTLGYAYQGIFLVDETTGERVCHASMGWPDAPADWRIPPGQGITERVLLDGQLHYTPDVTQEPDYIPGLGSSAEVDAPIYVGGKVIGVLAVESREPHAFGPEDFEVIESAANQAGIAISNARSLEVARRRAQEAETLRQAGAVVAATLQQDEAIQRILEQLERVVPYDSASVQLLREGYLEIVGGRGWEDPAAVLGLRFPVPGDNPNTVVIQEHRPYILDDAPAAHAPFRDD